MIGRSRFSESYKQEAVAKAKASGKVSQTARELGISNKTLHVWMKQDAPSSSLDLSEASPHELAARVRQLEQQLSVRDKQVEVLKKAISIVSQVERIDLR